MRHDGCPERRETDSRGTRFEELVFHTIGNLAEKWGGEVGDKAEADITLIAQREFLVLTGLQSDSVRGSVLRGAC